MTNINETIKVNDNVIIDDTGTTILSDEDINSIANTLSESKNETDSLLDKIEEEYKDYDNSNDPLEEGISEYISDGTLMETDDSNILEFDHFKNIDSDLNDIISDNIKENLSDKYDISDEEAVKFANLITKVRAKENINIYPELPAKLKEQLDLMVDKKNIPLKNRAAVLEYTAKSIIEELINDAELDTLAIDMEKAMKELVPMPLEIYSEVNKEYIEDEFLKIAEKIKDETPKTAENLLNMRRGYIDGYTYGPMYEMFKNPKIQKNIRRCDVLWSRTNTEYLRLAEACKFKLHPLNTIYNALIKLNFLDYQAKRLITLFVYTYTNNVADYKSEEEYNDIYRNAFANYFEGNIINLVIVKNNPSDFSKQVMNNLVELCDYIDRAISAKEEELSNNKKKK